MSLTVITVNPWVERAPPPRLPSFFLGLDLGQANDYSALAVVRQVPDGDAGEPRYELVGLKRWPLSTAYPQVVADVGAILDREPLNVPETTFALDYTGCGRPVLDMFLVAGMKPKAIAITAGNAVLCDGDEYHVPMRDLASVVAVLLQSGRLKWPATLPEAGMLKTELQNFRVKVTAAGNDTYAAWREGMHDDLVLATAIACWSGENILPPPEWQFS